MFENHDYDHNAPEVDLRPVRDDREINLLITACKTRLNRLTRPMFEREVVEALIAHITGIRESVHVDGHHLKELQAINNALSEENEALGTQLDRVQKTLGTVTRELERSLYHESLRGENLNDVIGRRNAAIMGMPRRNGPLEGGARLVAGAVPSKLDYCDEGRLSGTKIQK